MAALTLHLLAHELDKKRKQIEKSLESTKLDAPGRIRLEGMQAGIVYARLLLHQIVTAADAAKEEA